MRMNHHTSGGFFVKCDSDWMTSMISFVLIAMTYSIITRIANKIVHLGWGQMSILACSNVKRSFDLLSWRSGTRPWSGNWTSSIFFFITFSVSSLSTRTIWFLGTVRRAPFSRFAISTVNCFLGTISFWLCHEKKGTSDKYRQLQIPKVLDTNRIFFNLA